MNEHLSVLRRGDLPGVELWRIRGSRRRWAFHHQTYAFCAARGERIELQAWRRRILASPSAVGLHAPGGLWLVTAVDAAADYDLVLVDPSRVEAALGGAGTFHGGRHFSDAQVEDPELLELHGRLVELHEHPVTPGAPQILERFVRSAFRHTHEDPPLSAASGARPVKLARSFIEREYPSRISLDDIARVAGVSKFHLTRSFNTCIGLPLYRYLKAVRVGRALALLRSGLRPADVVGLAGFVDQPHITRVFRRELGITPGRYRDGITPATTEDAAADRAVNTAVHFAGAAAETSRRLTRMLR